MSLTQVDLGSQVRTRNVSSLFMMAIELMLSPGVQAGWPGRTSVWHVHVTAMSLGDEYVPWYSNQNFGFRHFVNLGVLQTTVTKQVEYGYK